MGGGGWDGSTATAPTYFTPDALMALRIWASASSLQYLQLSCRKTDVYGTIMVVLRTTIWKVFPTSSTLAIIFSCGSDVIACPLRTVFTASRYAVTPGASFSGTNGSSASIKTIGRTWIELSIVLSTVRITSS